MAFVTSQPSDFGEPENTTAYVLYDNFYYERTLPIPDAVEHHHPVTKTGRIPLGVDMIGMLCLFGGLT